MNPKITLHPQMTAHQIAEWCSRHKMFVTIDYLVERNGRIEPLLTARPEPDLDAIPAFLRRQPD